MAENFQSEFVFGLTGKRYNDFVDSVRPIISQIVGCDDYELIDFKHHLSFKDFQNKDKSIASHLYNQFLYDIIKKDNKVSFKTKICITLDERLCNEICPNTGRKITTIKIGGVALAYFIYFDAKEFFDFVYDKNNDILNKVVEKKDLPPKSEILDSYQNDIDNQRNIVEKIGYIHNHNNGFSYIRTSINRTDTFRIPHSLFPEIKELTIGTVIKVKCRVNENGEVNKILSYQQCSDKEINVSFEEFEGKLEREFGKNFAFIKNYGTSIYVPPSWAKYFNEGQIYNVQCLAVESFDNNGNIGWEALEITEITEILKFGV